MSDFHNGIENNNLSLFVLMHICVSVSLKPNLNYIYIYIYILRPIIYIKILFSDVKSFLFHNTIIYILFTLNSLFQGDSLYCNIV
jgi:hypothetical protein